MSSRGSIKLYRSLFKHEFFRPGRFSEREAFTWVIAEAAWKPRSRRVGQFFVDLDRGELVASLRHLAEVWGWEVGAVRGYLGRCEKAKMLSTRSDKGITIVTVCNYDVYQGDDGDDNTVTDKVSAHGQQGLSTRPAHGQHNTEEGKKGIKEEGEEGQLPIQPSLLGDGRAVTVQKAPRKKRQKAVAIPLDPDFQLTEADRKYARDRKWTDQVIEHQFEKFKNHHIGKGNQWADWHRAWMTWVGNGYDFKGGARSTPSAPSRADSAIDGIASRITEDDFSR